MKNLNIVILAAGLGSRMNSAIPKVLHKVGNLAMLEHVVNVARTLNPHKIVIVYGYGGDTVKSYMEKAYPENQFIWVYQKEQLGTGHALKCSVSHLDKSGYTLVLYGDVPLISSISLNNMLDKARDNVVMLTANVSDPHGYGRILRNQNCEIMGIREEKDASPDEKSITEINTGFYVLPNQFLEKWLNNLSTNNEQKEYYITDVIGMAYEEKVAIDYVNPLNDYEIMGVNNKIQLEYLERMWQMQKVTKLLECGVTVMDKNRIDIRGELVCGRDCIIDLNCIFIGKVVIGDNVTIGAGSILTDTVIANNVEIKPYSVIEDAVIGESAKIGPFSRIRPGSVLNSQVHVGNFVEIKKSEIGELSKVNHLTYIGDAKIGKRVNVGAGSVTCNYDGENKHKTVIEDDAFIGSGTMLVAPVTVGEGGLIGAGSTITKDAKAHELTLARAKQQTIEGFLVRKK